jgi:hypothetical protein
MLVISYVTFHNFKDLRRFPFSRDRGFICYSNESDCKLESEITVPLKMGGKEKTEGTTKPASNAIDLKR